MARTWTLSAKTSDRLKREIEKYVTILRPLSDPKTGGTIDLQAMDKPTSQVPTPHRFEELMDLPDNRAASRDLERIFAEMADKTRREPEPYFYLEVLSKAGLRDNDPAAVRRWRAGETERDRLLAELFEEALVWVANRFLQRYGRSDLKVIIYREDEPATSGRHAQVVDTNYSDRVVISKVEKIIEEEGPMPRKAAEGLLSDREDYSPRRIRLAYERQSQVDRGERAS